MNDLAERVYAVLSIEVPGRNGALDWCAREPAHIERGELTEFELDLRDWGLAYGFAYALARSEDPFESGESVGRRALEAAQLATAKWGAGWHQRGEVIPPEATVTPIRIGA